MKKSKAGKHIISAIVLLILVGLAVGSSDNSDNDSSENEVVQSRIRDIEIKRAPLAEEVAEIRRNIESMKSRIQSKNNDYKNLENSAYAYMWEHKMAVACIYLGAAGLDMSLSKSNIFTPDERIIGGVTSIIAVAYALGNLEEIVTVFDKLTQLEFKAENIKNEISSIESQIDHESERLNAKWKELQLLNISIVDLRGENSSPLIDGTNFVVCISNDTNKTLKFQYKWGEGSSWKDKSIEPGYRNWFWHPRYDKMDVKFDYSFSEGYQEKSYYLETHITDEEPECEIAKRYQFSDKNGSIDLYYIN